MKNQYFLKDKKAQVYKKTYGGRDPDGFRTGEGYVPLAPSPLWCYTRQTSQVMRQMSFATGEMEERYFVFNNLSTVEVGDYILYKGKWYQITRVDTADDYKSDMFIYVALSGRLGIPPEEDEFLPYGTPVISE